MNQGWTCPKCNRVFAPWVTECSYCNNFQQPFYPQQPFEPYPNPWYPGQPWYYEPYTTCSTNELNTPEINIIAMN